MQSNVPHFNQAKNSKTPIHMPNHDFNVSSKQFELHGVVKNLSKDPFTPQKAINTTVKHVRETESEPMTDAGMDRQYKIEGVIVEASPFAHPNPKLLLKELAQKYKNNPEDK